MGVPDASVRGLTFSLPICWASAWASAPPQASFTSRNSTTFCASTASKATAKGLYMDDSAPRGAGASATEARERAAEATAPLVCCGAETYPAQLRCVSANERGALLRHAGEGLAGLLDG